MAATLITLLVSLLMPADGIVTRQVWAPCPGGNTVSPDGRYISYVNWKTGNMAVYENETGESRDITDEGKFKGGWEYGDHSIWSPDGQQVAYFWNKGKGELRIVDLDGSKPRILCASGAKGEHTPFPFDWSKDGKYILAYGGTKDESLERGYEVHIILVSVADGSQRILKSFRARGPGGFAYMSLSPDGQYVVYQCQEKEGYEKRDIYLLATDGSGESTLVEHPADDWAPLWAPDGNRIVFASDRSGSIDVWMLDVVDGKPEGSPILAKSMGSHYQPLGFTADGSLYYGIGTPAIDIYIATLDFEAGKVVAPPTKTSLRYEGTNYKPFWSRDGKYLAYASSRGAGNSNNLLVIRSLETGQERDITPQAEDVVMLRRGWGRPKWSPDGSSILLTGAHQKWNSSVYLLDPKTGKTTMVLPDIQDEEGRKRGRPHNPIFSKDGKQIFYTRRSDTKDGQSIAVYDLETRQDRELYKANNTAIRNLALSPDGQRLAFFEAAPYLWPSVLKTISISGGQASELYALEEGNRFSRRVGLSWTPDGKHVVVGGPEDAGKGDELWRIPVAGGELSKLSLGFEVNHFSLHPDGQRIAFTRRDPKAGSEVWVMENFLP